MTQRLSFSTGPGPDVSGGVFAMTPPALAKGGHLRVFRLTAVAGNAALRRRMGEP